MFIIIVKKKTTNSHLTAIFVPPSAAAVLKREKKGSIHSGFLSPLSLRCFCRTKNSCYLPYLRRADIHKFTLGGEEKAGEGGKKNTYPAALSI